MIEAISPIDGRYANKTRELANFFSEHALIKYRVFVEIEYFLALTTSEIKNFAEFPQEKVNDIRNIHQEFTTNESVRIKEIEKQTNHDVKAVEYFLKEKFRELQLEKYSEFIHFGLTSQDINNTAVPLSLKEGLTAAYLPVAKQLKDKIRALSHQWSKISLLSHTHGQPASPSTLGKEIYVFADRLNAQIDTIVANKYYAKFGGAVGNLNAHKVTFPQIDWINFSNNFISSIGLKRLPFTTQIDHYDFLVNQLQNLKRVNTILIDLSRDIWTYISMGYFSQKTKAGEVGSSTMPHKVNPIDFENAEGNLGMANAIFTFLIDKLPISRLQRDLTDSTVLRNLGVPIAHTLIAYKSLLKGLEKLEVNQSNINDDLEKNWAVVSEAYQTILRREGIAQPYELLKELTRGKSTLTKEDLHEFVRSLSIDDHIKNQMLSITPQNYLGYTELP